MPKRLVLTGLILLVALIPAGWAMSRNNVSSSHAAGAHRTVAGSLTWRVVRYYTTRSIKNEYLPAKAKGVYVVMNVAATNHSTHVMTIGDDRIKLALGSTKYPVSTAGADGLELSGRPLLSGATLAAKATFIGWVAFDVPPAAVSSSLTSTPSLCIGACAAQPQV